MRKDAEKEYSLLVNILHSKAVKSNDFQILLL